MCWWLGWWRINQPAISVGSVTSLEPSQTVLNCSGTGNSLCGTTEKKTVKTWAASWTAERGDALRVPHLRHSRIRRLLVVSGCSSRSSWRWRCRSWGSPYSGRPGSPPSCWWKWWELVPTPKDRPLAITDRWLDTLRCKKNNNRKVILMILMWEYQG